MNPFLGSKTSPDLFWIKIQNTTQTFFRMYIIYIFFFLINKTFEVHSKQINYKDSGLTKADQGSGLETRELNEVWVGYEKYSLYPCAGEMDLKSWLEAQTEGAIGNVAHLHRPFFRF